MTDAVSDEAIEAPKSSKLPLIIGVLLGLAGAGGGYFITSSGMLFGSESASKQQEKPTVESSQKFSFVPLDPLTISLHEQGGDRHLRFRAELEVAGGYVNEVETIRPRIIDVLNGYLRAVELNDLKNPASLTRLRAQMLRRVQVVAGPEKVNDLLIMEFVIN